MARRECDFMLLAFASVRVSGPREQGEEASNCHSLDDFQASTGPKVCIEQTAPVTCAVSRSKTLTYAPRNYV